jgi:gas vesicle protein
VGGVSFGTIITFIITQIKVLIKDKNKNKAVDTVVSTADNLCAELSAREKQRDAEIEQLSLSIQAQQKEIAEREEYFEKVLSTTFQAISYLVIASKLPTEDKIALQEKFTTLLQHKTTEYKEVVKDEVKAVVTEVKEEIIPDVTQTIINTVEETKSLLDKYTSEV